MAPSNFVTTLVTTLLVTLFLLILLKNTHLSPQQWRGRGDFSFYIYKKVVTMIYIVCDFMMLMCHHIGGDKSGDKLLNGRNFIQDSSNVKKASIFFFARPISFFIAFNSPIITGGGIVDHLGKASAGPSQRVKPLGSAKPEKALRVGLNFENGKKEIDRLCCDFLILSKSNKY